MPSVESANVPAGVSTRKPTNVSAAESATTEVTASAKPASRVTATTKAASRVTATAASSAAGLGDRGGNKHRQDGA